MKKRIHENIVTLSLGIASAAFFATSCTTMDLVSGEQTRNMFTVQEDIELGEKAFAEVKTEMAKKKTATVSKDPKAIERVQTIANRIFDASGQRGVFKFEAVLFDSEVVNAFAVPGGKIAVFSGLWDPKHGLVQDDDELAAVIAHEVAHVTCRHSTEEMTRQMPSQLLLSAAGVYAEYRDDSTWKSAVETAFVVYDGLVVPKYSRTNEMEADRISLGYLSKAGYDPAAAVRLWKRACEKEGEEPGLMSILSTHPSNKLRYETLERQVAMMTAQNTPASASPPGLSPSPAPLSPLLKTATSSTPKTMPPAPVKAKSEASPKLAPYALHPSVPSPPMASSPPPAPSPPQAPKPPEAPAPPQAPSPPGASRSPGTSHSPGTSRSPAPK